MCRYRGVVFLFCSKFLARLRLTKSPNLATLQAVSERALVARQIILLTLAALNALPPKIRFTNFGHGKRHRIPPQCLHSHLLVKHLSAGWETVKYLNTIKY